MSNRTEARSAKAARMHATGRLPLLRLFSTPLRIRESLSVGLPIATSRVVLHKELLDLSDQVEIDRPKQRVESVGTGKREPESWHCALGIEMPINAPTRTFEHAIYS